MSPGDLVMHRRSGRRMFVESVNGFSVGCAWFAEGVLRHGVFHSEWLVASGTVLA